MAVPGYRAGQGDGPGAGWQGFCVGCGADVVQDAPGGVDVGGGVGGPDAGDGSAGGVGQVGEPVGAGGGQLAGVGEQDADVTVGLVAAGAGGAQGGQDRIIVLPGGV